MPRSFGRKTAPLLKFRRPDTPRNARDFKQAFPADFEALKEQTGGRDFSDELLSRLREEYESPIEWTVVEAEYDPEGARQALRFYLRHMRDAPDAGYVAERLAALEAKGDLCSPNMVLKLCVQYEDVGLDEREAKILESISNAAAQSGHPHEDPPLFCIGWVRYCDNGRGTMLIEEVQTDLGGVRRSAQEPHMVRQMRAQGLQPREVLATIDLLLPWEERFYEDAVGLLLELAAKDDTSVEMVDYSYKRDENSPQSVYRDLPRSMGMKLSDGSAVAASLGKTWKIVPNRRR